VQEPNRAKLDSELSFEIRSKDLLGRIGLLRTKNGTLETPLLLPVVNPNSQAIPARELRGTFGFDALITSSYLVWRKFREEREIPRIHELLNFDGVIETDSGAYQILQYGDVEVQPNEIIRFQERLDSDIAVILDVPTGQESSKERAKWTVDETIRRADQALGVVARKDILWVGPVQGGVYPDLVAHSAREMAKRDFSIYALGSPTPVMQQYRYDVLVNMVMAAKSNLPPDRPLHLFGAGHPMMFALAVAMGCDIFDSASYAIFARNGRYMTAQGTAKIEDLEYFPCNCPACHKRIPEEVRKLLLLERDRFLASHNLHICFSELQTIKQAIVDGRLWELVETRSRNHPALQIAFQRMLTFAGQLEKETPVRKRKGPFILSADSLNRPEVLRYQRRLLERYSSPAQAKKLFLIPEAYLEPFRGDAPLNDPLRKIERRSDVHLCSYGLTFGIIPQELLDVYPLSQTESALSPTTTTVNRVLKRIINFMEKNTYKRCTIVVEKPWQEKIARLIQAKFKRKLRVIIIEATGTDHEMLSKVLKALK
jgi:7-cyano-7-deazaguanine tRNA-ribosyltransferase